MIRLLVLALLACGGTTVTEQAPSVQVFIGRTGVYVKTERVASLAELTPDRVRAILSAVAPDPDGRHRILVDARLATGDALYAILRGASQLGWKSTRVGVWRDEKIQVTCSANFAPAFTNRDERVMLAVHVGPQITVGLSRVVEFQTIEHRENLPLALESLSTILKEHRWSAFFSDRDDIELAFDQGLPLALVTGSLSAACKHFKDRISIVAPSELAARPR